VAKSEEGEIVESRAHQARLSNSFIELFMRTITLMTIVVAALTLNLAAADKKPKLDPGKLPAASDKKGLTFDHDIKPILEKSCLKCHGMEKPKSKYRVDTRENFIKGGESDDAAVVPGDSAKSLVAYYVSDLVEEMEMPPTEKREKYPQLSKEQIGILRAWIDQGAK
jgi:hypothetical protein